MTAEIHIAHSVMTSKGYKTFTVRAYVNDDGVMHMHTVASDETLEDASSRAIKKIRRDFWNSGRKPPETIVNGGKMAAIMLDNWRF